MYTHFATLATGNAVMITARFITADLAGYKALSGCRTVGISCRVMLLCKQKKDATSSVIRIFFLIYSK